MIKKDVRYIIKRVIIGVLISLALSFIYSTAHAEELQMTASDGYWYNSTGSQVLQVQATSVNRNSEPFYVYQGSTSVQTQFLRAVMYFPESQNDNVLNSQWDVSFVVLGYGNFSLVLGGSACYTLSTGTNFNSSFIWRSDGVYSNGQTEEDVSGNMITENSETSPLWRSVYCPNVKFNRVPTEVKMFRDWHDGSDNNKNRLMISKYWYLRKTLNDNSGVESAINNSTSSINQNQNQNTQSIINNQNQNNQSVINNQNQNTDKEIESQKVCNTYDKNSIEIDNRYLNYAGDLTYRATDGVSKYIKVNSKSIVKKLNTPTIATGSICFYNINKTLINCTVNANVNIGEVTLPNGTEYIRFSIYKSENKPQYEVCNNGNQATTNAINETNDTLKDSSIDDPTNDLNDMASNESTNSVISDLLLLPVTLFQNIVNSINGTCSTFNLGSLFGTNLTLPCINISGLIGSQLWGVIDILFCGIFILSIRKKFVDIFENITSLKDRGNELE